MDRGIIFSGPMVRALLDGRKTMTRRLAWGVGKRGLVRPTIWQKVRPGDRLWVKHAADLFPEYYRQIEFGDGKYAVSTDGNIYAWQDGCWQARATRLSHNGYEEISLRHNGEQRSFRINRLVAEAFYGPPPEGHVCRHIDGTRRNNRPGNLDWGTPSQNSADAAAAGSFSGERASKAQLSANDVAVIRASNEPQASLASQFRVGQPTISKIKSGKRWAEPPAPPARNFPPFKLWRSPRFMPRWASSLTLEVTAVKMERLQEISEEDVEAEGCVTRLSGDLGFDACLPQGADMSPYRRACDAFRDLWDHLHGPGAWKANPEVVAMTFKAYPHNIDQEKAG